MCGFHTRGVLLYSCDTLNRGVGHFGHSKSGVQVRPTKLVRPLGKVGHVARLHQHVVFLAQKQVIPVHHVHKQAAVQRGKRGGHGRTVMSVQLRDNGQVSPSAKAQKARL